MNGDPRRPVGGQNVRSSHKKKTKVSGDTRGPFGAQNARIFEAILEASADTHSPQGGQNGVCSKGKQGVERRDAAPIRGQNDGIRETRDERRHAARVNMLRLPKKSRDAWKHAAPLTTLRGQNARISKGKRGETGVGRV